MSGIHLAAHANVAKLMSYLLEAGLFAADVKDHFGRTPLIWAAKHGHEAVVKLLVHRQDVEINAVEKREMFGHPRTALVWAAWKGHTGTVKLLLERDDIDVNFVDHEETIPPLKLAAVIEPEAARQALLKHEGIILDYKASLRVTALHRAAARRHAGIVQILLERDDIDADRKSGSGMTPFATATVTGDVQVVKLFLKRKDVDLNSRNNDGQTVLQLATWWAKVNPKELRRHETLKLICAAIQARSGTTHEHPPVAE